MNRDLMAITSESNICGAQSLCMDFRNAPATTSRKRRTFAVAQSIQGRGKLISSDIDLSATIVVGSVVFFAFFVRGVSGFGSATIAIPLMAHVVPLKLAVPLLLVLDFLATLATLRIDRHLVDQTEVRRLIPYAVIGVVVGALLLTRLAPGYLLAGLGTLVIFFGARTLSNPAGDTPVSHWWAMPAGLTGGVFGGMFGSGAATPYVIYLSHRLRDKRRVRATFSGFAFFDYGFRIVTFIATGLLLQWTLGPLFAIGIPAMATGLYLGNRLHHRISNEQALRVIGVLLILCGLSLLAKVWLTGTA